MNLAQDTYFTRPTNRGKHIFLGVTRPHIKYHQDNYLDGYLRVIKGADPLSTALVFNCGMGAVRTTFAMVAACIIRRKQLMNLGLEDPYAVRSVGSRSGISSVSDIVLALHIYCSYSFQPSSNAVSHAYCRVMSSVFLSFQPGIRDQDHASS